MGNNLTVWLGPDIVGTLSVTTGRLSFQYHDQWLSRSDAVALSQSLPLQTEIFDDQQCRPFFAGLLPEGHLRSLLARQYRVSNQNDFALLDAIGGECAGAISLHTANTPLNPLNPPDYAPSSKTLRWLTNKELISLLQELPKRPMLAGQDGIRLSLAGAQDKLPVVVDLMSDGFTDKPPGKDLYHPVQRLDHQSLHGSRRWARISLPQGTQPSTHILKPAIPRAESSVLNEGFCLLLARSLGLLAAKADLVLVGDQYALLVERYDRHQHPDGRVHRIHQEDFCQALGVVPEMKYQSEGGPDFKACFALIRQATRPSAPELLRLLDAVIFNAVIGNHDAHAKNFSLLYTREGPILAPLYDLLSTAIYDELTPKMAMKIGSEYIFNEVRARHWEHFAETAGLSKAQTKKRVIRLAQELPAAAKTLQLQAPFNREPVIEKIVTLIERRANQILLEGERDRVGPAGE